MPDTPARPANVFSADAIDAACRIFFGAPWLSYNDPFRADQTDKMRQALNAADAVHRQDELRLLGDILDNAHVLPAATTKDSSVVRSAERSGAVPAGYVLVPIKPTDEMLLAADAAMMREEPHGMVRGRSPARIWPAMLAAAPEPQQGAQENPYAAAARVIALHLQEFCDKSLQYPDMIADAARKAAAEIERLRPVSPHHGGELVATEFTEEHRRAYAPASAAGPEDMAIYDRIAGSYFDSVPPAVPATPGAHCIPRGFSDGAAPVSAPAPSSAEQAGENSQFANSENYQINSAISPATSAPAADERSAAVIGAPDRIWLNVGELLRDTEFSELQRTGDVSWCDDKIDASDVEYIRADAARAQASEPVSAPGDFEATVRKIVRQPHFDTYAQQGETRYVSEEMNHLRALWDACGGAPADAREGEQDERDREVGRKWRTNSSLEEWFPYTGGQLARAEADAPRIRYLMLEMSSQEAQRIGVLLDGGSIDDMRRVIDRAMGAGGGS